ncbi:beta-fructofuranosidase-like protein [Angomonas deanei]|uniref:Calcineurin-like phosphoesterase, putative n=1 Tax=Angomonas deanei TaxID=59799 RepID=A0A7G2C5G6_9TRYP|nr:beta-fructofuranosidase-like protein [Angomonas deanei]CAD2214839.1 Calcineurin-like phosphoesterase, putative [Angomonas deanei]|eukprot:EPY37691.1 beta-fructofuranosidase-like protein [Angomonas deanei]
MLSYSFYFAAWFLSLSTASAYTINLISDIHYDPAYGTGNGYVCTSSTSPPLGKATCDSPKLLVDLFINDAKSQNSTFTIFGGDFQRHHFSSSGTTIAETFGGVAEALATTVEEHNVIATIGNNDVVPDYTFDWEHPGEDDGLLERVGELKKYGIVDADEAKEMNQCGYYVRHTEEVDFIVLHTLVWTYALKPTVPDTEADPCGQLEFLSTSLASARTNGKKVFVLGHIPPVLNVYKVKTSGKFTSDSGDVYWRSRFLKRYVALMTEYNDCIVLQLYGHTHMYALLTDEAVGVPLMILPSVSPIFANQPSYLVADFDAKSNLKGLFQRYLDPNTSTIVEGMNILGAMGLPYGLGHPTILTNSTRRLLTSDEFWQNYRLLQSGGVLTNHVYTTCDSFCRAVIVCSQLHFDYTQIKTCVETNSKTTPNTAVPVNARGSIITSILILGSVFIVCVILVATHYYKQKREAQESYNFV